MVQLYISSHQITVGIQTPTIGITRSEKPPPSVAPSKHFTPTNLEIFLSPAFLPQVFAHAGEAKISPANAAERAQSERIKSPLFLG